MKAECRWWLFSQTSHSTASDRKLPKHRTYISNEQTAAKHLFMVFRKSHHNYIFDLQHVLEYNHDSGVWQYTQHTAANIKHDAWTTLEAADIYIRIGNNEIAYPLLCEHFVMEFLRLDVGVWARSRVCELSLCVKCDELNFCTFALFSNPARFDGVSLFYIFCHIETQFILDYSQSGAF